MTEQDAKELVRDVEMACKKRGAWCKMIAEHEPVPHLARLKLEITIKIDKKK